MLSPYFSPLFFPYFFCGRRVARQVL